MATGCTTSLRVVHPVVTDCNKLDYQSLSCSTNGMTNRMVAQPFAWLVCPRSCTIYGATLCDWSHDHARPVCDLLRFAITNPEFWIYYLPCCDQICSYNHPRARILRSITRFVTILWSYLGRRNMVAGPVWLELYQLFSLIIVMNSKTYHPVKQINVCVNGLRSTNSCQTLVDDILINTRLSSRHVYKV